MSMYTQLLAAALREVSPNGTTTAAEAMAELNRCRNRLADYGSREGADWASTAVADELSYDIALIEIAREFGVRCDVSDFDNPGRGRARVERDLESRGIVLGAPDQEAEPSQRR
jgi:hypothetical protein